MNNGVSASEAERVPAQAHANAGEEPIAPTDVLDVDAVATATHGRVQPTSQHGFLPEPLPVRRW